MLMHKEEFIEAINQDWTDIYYHLHHKHHDGLSHQAVRLLQHLEKTGMSQSEIWPIYWRYPIIPRQNTRNG